MALNYTYEDFEKAASDAGMLGNFSEYDLKLAKQNPAAGMSILQYKIDFVNAKTAEAQALANAGAEQIRKQYGGYTAGSEGSNYYLEPISPSSFTPETAPTYANNYSDALKEQADKLLNYGSFETSAVKPDYTNRYDSQIQEVLAGITNREEFSYDPDTDPLYSAYKKQYAREGQRATADTMGAAAAASGGIPSSYAASAAAQAGNYYAAQAADKMPELYELAFNKYLNEFNMQLSELSALQMAEQSDYDKYLTELSQYNTDRSFDYQKWLDEFSMGNTNLDTLMALEQGEYQKYLDALSQYNTDRNFNYGQHLDEITHQANRREEERQAELDAFDREYTLAALGGRYGDYSGLNELGITPTATEAEELEKALYAASYGDYSLLNALGITPGKDAPIDVDDDDGGTGEIPLEKAISELETAYPDMVIRRSVVEDITRHYGLDEAALEANGFTISD